MRRLHLQFYVAIVATLAVFVIANIVFWNLPGPASRGEVWSMDTASQLADSLLPPTTATPEEQQRAIENLRHRLRMDFALYDAQGHQTSTAGHIPQLETQHLQQQGWMHTRAGAVWILQLSGHRTLVVRPQRMSHVPGWHMLLVPLSIVLAFAIGAYPIATRLTRRLAQLRAGVDQLGTGDLSARVPVSGRDEVAALARSFNASAGRIEALVNSHKLLLANCSHELRTPLARIRLGLERIGRDSNPALHDELARSIAELDQLIGEMLLSSRLDAIHTLENTEEVDLLALVAEEASHFDRPVEGEAVIIKGDASLLRRLTRNLLDNAQRHAGGATRVRVSRNAQGFAELTIDDQGGGVPEADREKIFEPFYRVGRGGGFGLGLSLVRQIARAHGGEVSYTALAEGGSRFSVTLPK